MEKLSLALNLIIKFLFHSAVHETLNKKESLQFFTICSISIVILELHDYGFISEKTKVSLSEARLHASIRGDLKSLQWLGLPESCNKDKSSKVEVTVHYSSLNFRDLMLAAGRIHPDSVSGGMQAYLF